MLEEQFSEFNKNEDKNIVRSWAGGVDGREVTNLVLKNLSSILSPNGIFYLLLLKENKPYEIIEQLEKSCFKSFVIKERKIRGEHLFVLKISRNKVAEI